MKFAKLLAKNIAKYEKDISYDLWFPYKMYKKRLKIIAHNYTDVLDSRKLQASKYNELSSDCNEYKECNECCICLESNGLMKTFCCHNYIHHACLVHTLSFTNSLCPLCRTKIEKAITFNKEDMHECLDSEIISIISSIHIDFMKFSCLYRNYMIHDVKIANLFYELNLLAIEKLCKKIDKHLFTNTRPYFQGILQKNKIVLKNTKPVIEQSTHCAYCTLM